MSNPGVFVVMPSYNQARFIRQAIDSVLHQDYEPLRLLVMDGGSDDGTVDILRSYGDRLEFVSRRDRGQSDALNQGLARARGDIVCWLNSDDAFMPGALRTVADAFRRRPAADFVYGRGWNIDEQGRLLCDSGVQPFNLWKLIHHRNYIHQPSCFFRRSLLDRVGPVQEDLHYVMDWELWIRFGAHKGVYLEEFLSCNRVYAEAKTQSGALRRWAEIRRLVRSYTAQRFPPVLWLYLLETLLGRLHARPLLSRVLRRPLVWLFEWGMTRELSGLYPDGLLEPTFRFSVPNRTNGRSVRLTLSPLSRYDGQALGGRPVRVRWRSGGRRSGAFELAETGLAQDIILPLDPDDSAPFAHFHCRANSAGRPISGGAGLPARRAVGFLDDLTVLP
jgi:glycosyltransferase involved in cell wall biosynthesis